MGVQDKDPLVQLSLPPGFRFYPTDEELMVQYLCRKVAGHHFSLPIIGDIDLYKFDPWVLPGKAMFGEKEWYFFSPRDRKYPNGSRPNRVAGSGYWKATGTDKIITSEGRKVGIKKALVFYVGKAPKGSKTNWIMHEYRLFQSTAKSGGTRLDDWVLCRIYNKHSSAAKPTTSNVSSPTSSYPGMGDQLVGFPGMSYSGGASNVDQKVPLGLPSFGSFDWGVWAGMNDGPEEGAFGLGQAQMMDQHHVGGHVTLPSLPPLCHVDSPEEVRGLRVNGSGDLFGQRYTGSGDPFAIRWPDLGLGNEWASVNDHMG